MTDRIDAPARGNNRFHRKLSKTYRKHFSTWLTRSDERSGDDVAVMMPLSPKDVERARVSIGVIRKNLAHPISKFVVVAPDSEEIRTLCRDVSVDYVNEELPLAGLVGSGDTMAMSGWIRQQFLKLISPQITGCERVITFDSDTYPIRPTRFLDENGRIVLYLADPDPIAYWRFVDAALGQPSDRNTCYVAHCMLFDRWHLEKMYAVIEEVHGRRWDRVLLDLVNQPYAKAGRMSEFQLFGVFLARNYPDHIQTRYYSNTKVQPHDFARPDNLPWHKRRFRFVSNHQHGT